MLIPVAVCVPEVAPTTSTSNPVVVVVPNRQRLHLNHQNQPHYFYSYLSTQFQVIALRLIHQAHLYNYSLDGLMEPD